MLNGDDKRLALNAEQTKKNINKPTKVEPRNEGDWELNLLFESLAACKYVLYCTSYAVGLVAII